MVAVIKVYATVSRTDDSREPTEEVDAAEVAQWLGEALSNPDVRDSHKHYEVHSVEVDKEGT